MGIVSDYVLQLIAKQVDERRLVVWFDPEPDYADFIAALALPDTTIARYDGSFFQLRHDISPLLDGEEPPRLVVYAPLAEEATEDALIELTAAGVVLKPGQQPWQRNTRLSVLAKAALKDVLGLEQAQRIEKQVNDGQLSLADLDRLAERAGGKEAHGVISVIFGTGSPEEVALNLLSGDAKDAEIAARQALTDIAGLLAATYRVALPPGETLNELRARLARHVLCTELLATLQPPLPSQLESVSAATEPAARDTCIHLARRWRETLGVSASYVSHANRVEQELGLAGLAFPLEQVRNCETFAAIDTAAESATEAQLAAQPTANLTALTALIAFAERREHGFWAEQRPETQQRWALVATIGRLRLHADEIEPELKRPELTASELFQRYTGGAHPWCELDTLYRQLEQQARRCMLTSHDEPLKQLIAMARSRYMDVGDQLATRFTHAYEKASFSITGTTRQRDIFQRLVSPALRLGKTGYMVVDALRYEMARDLARDLRADHEVTLEAVLGTAPTITEIGMAALLPEAQADDARVVAAGPSKLGLALSDTIMRDRKGRIEWLKARAGVNAEGKAARVYDITLDNLLTLRPDAERQAREADLIFVLSDEIDAVAESDNISLAWSFMDELLSHITSGIRRLTDLGCWRIIIAADHGYLFGDELDTGMKLDPPSASKADLHRRVWVGTGAARSDSYLHARLAQFGMRADDLEIAVPWGFGAFRTPGGARAYFHGGLSLPELVVPAALLAPAASDSAMLGSQNIAWQLTPGSRKITSTFCSISITGQRVGLFSAAPPPTRVEIRAGGAPITRMVAATYGFSEATGEVRMVFATDDDAMDKLRPNTVTLELTSRDRPSQAVTVHLLDALTNRELARVEGLELTASLFT
ncbi:MAG TPA: PglZ domain-containing protein [Ktedonobacterales bacterium]|nr:PglZ domain-containing protein [Ktedonobacterales bacterium]